MRKNNVHTRTEWLLEHVPETRDSDKKLLLIYWSKEGLKLSEEQERAFMNCTTPESITRARRALKADYPSSKAVDDERYLKFKAYQDNYGDKHYQYF
jgi:hypothetical protein